jgi:hypothetical protein
MWSPDTVQISKDLIEAEVQGTIPIGSSTAAAVFTMNSATKETARSLVERFNLDRNAATVAWKFLQTGQIATSDGEILTETIREAASPAPPAPSRPSAPSDYQTESVNECLKKHFPNWVDATPEQAENIRKLARDMSVIDNALYVFANNGTEIQNPITLLLWKLKNASTEQIAQERAILEKKGRSSDSLVRETMRKADAIIPSLPTPQATREGTDLIRSLRERVDRGRS